MSGTLDDIDGRLRWARDHIREIEEDVRMFLDDGPMYETSVEVQPDGVTYVYYVQERRALPSDLRFKVGDVIHNLRASLDNIAYGLVSTYRTPSWNTAFPVCRKAAQFQRKAVPKFAGIPQDAIDVIESFQPYNGPHGQRAHWLKILDDRWNRDKHRTPTLVGLIPGRSSYLESDGDVIDYAIYVDQSLKDGMAVAHVTYASRQHTRQDPHFTFAVALDEALTPFNWRTIPDSLKSAHDLITHGYYGVLPKLRPFFS